MARRGGGGGGGADPAVRLKPVAHVPSAGFRGHAHDMQSMGEWVGEVTDPDRQTKTMNPKELGQEFFRYEAVFNELCAQAAVLSPRFAQLLLRMWRSASDLLRRLVHAINSVDGQRLRAEREAAEAHRLKKLQGEQFMVQLTQMKIEATVASAAIRERDGQIAANNRTLRLMSDEVLRLRQVIGTYIEGNPVHEEDVVVGGVGRTRARTATVDADESAKSLQRPPKTQDFPDVEPYDLAEIIAKEAEKETNLLDMGDEIDSFFAQVAQEQQRQTKFITDIDLLVSNIDPNLMASSQITRLHQQHASIATQTDIAGVQLAPKSLAASVDDSEAATEPLDGQDEADVGPMLSLPRFVEDQGTASVPLPLEIKPLVKTTPHSMRIPSLTATLRMVMGIWVEKLNFDQQCTQQQQPLLPMPQFLHMFLTKKYGLEELADVHMVQMQSAILHHRKHKRINLIGRMIGSFNVDAPPPLDSRDTKFLMRLLAFFRQANELTDSVAIDNCLIEVNRAAAIQAGRHMFEAILADDASALEHRLTNNPLPLSKNAKKIDLDDAMEVVTKTWVDLNDSWEAHLLTLFELHCERYYVKEELRFCVGDDDNRAARDTMVVMVPPDKRGSMAKARPLRDYERAMGMLDPSSAKAKAQAQAREVAKRQVRRQPTRTNSAVRLRNRSDSFGEGSFGSEGGLSDGPYSEEEGAEEEPSLADGDEHSIDGEVNDTSGPEQDLVELMPLYRFKRMIAQIFPEFGSSEEQLEGVTESPEFDVYTRPPTDEVTRLWEHGLKLADERRQAEFDKIWEKRETGDGKPYWLNKWAKTYQWKLPYHPSNFHAEDLERHDFVKLCKQNELLPQSPFCKLLDRAPSDLWRDSEMFLLEYRKKRARIYQKEVEERAKFAASQAAEQLGLGSPRAWGSYRGSRRGSVRLSARKSMNSGRVRSVSGSIDEPPARRSSTASIHLP